jgi:hypothetical protein
MRKRLVCCISGGLLGFALASTTVTETLGLSPLVGIAFSAGLGLALGYVVSTLIDVFTAKPDSLLSTTRHSG